jgi:endo-1,4-beta-xylanase
MSVRRRLVGGAAVLGLLVGAAAVGRGQSTPAAAGAGASATPTLKQAAGPRMLMGAAVSAEDLDNPRMVELIAKQFNCLTAGNEFKPDSLQHEKGQFTFDKADKIADFAQQHGMKLVGHNLMWHQQAPKWLFEDAIGKPLPREQALANLKNHIDTVMKHFQGKVIGWDVVNEAIGDSEPYLRDTPAHKAIGEDFVIQAFKLAHAADPNVQLYYNDYNIEEPYKHPKAMRLIKDLKAAGCKVDAVGIQGHWLLNSPDVKLIDKAISDFAGLGVKVMVTELDVDVLPRKGAGADISATEQGGLDPYKDGLPADVEQKLAQRYGEIFKVLARHRDKGELTRVTFWGVTDGTSWLNFWPVKDRTNYPLVFDRNFQPKPAFDAVIRALEESPAAPAARAR